MSATATDTATHHATASTRGAVILVLVLVATYTGAVIGGLIAPANRLDGVHLAMIVGGCISLDRVESWLAAPCD